MELQRCHDEAQTLALAQQLKNKDIPEGGPHRATDKDLVTRRCVRAFVNSDESHTSYLDLGSIVGSLDVLGFMVWELAAEATNSTGYYIENGISKRYRDGVDIICRHLIGYLLTT